MTIEEMRDLVGLPADATDAQVVAAYAALVDDGYPASITLVEPVSIATACMQCRIDDSFEDSFIEQKIRSAREWVEDYTGRIIAQRTLVQHFRSWGRYLELYTRPVISIDAIVYNGADGDATYTGANYAIGVNPMRLYPGNTAFPALRAGGGIMVAYTAGYDAGEVPHSIIEAILVLIGGMMAEREGAYERSIKAAESMLARLRVPVI